MSDILGRHTNKCDYCNGKGWTKVKTICPQCKGRGFVVEDLDKPIKRSNKMTIMDNLLEMRRLINGLIEEIIQKLPNYTKECNCNNPVYVDFVEFNDIVDEWYLLWACINCGGIKNA